MEESNNNNNNTAKHHGYAQIDTVETSRGARLLYDMNLVFPEGTVTAILGPSGAGRSTLMHVLTDSLPSNVVGVGSIHLPGANAFVPQDDRLHGFFTVEAYMHHYARLAGVDKAYTKEQLETKIDNLLMEMGLLEHRNTIVGDVFMKGLSGGQKRRLSVCLEALTEPQNFFLDEPTSGLDAESAFQVMEFLRGYVHAAAGRRVILTIHQPNSFLWRKVDHVILLSKGKLVYEGKRSKMEAFFATNGHPTPKSWNPADHYVTMVNDEFRNHALNVDEWARRYKLWEATHHLGGPTNAAIKAAERFTFTNTPASMNNGNGSNSNANGSHTVSDNGSEPTTSVAPIPSERIETMRVGGFKAIGELTYRYFMNLWFNPGILATRVAMYTMLALMVGALFWELGERDDYESIVSRAAVLFYCVAFFIFMSVAVLPFTVMERAIVDKEVANKYYHPISYQVAQAIASIPGCAVLAGLVSVIIITMLKFKDPGWYFLNMFLALTTSEALALLVSHMVPHFVIGMALIAGMFGFFMLFQGFMLVPSDFPSWLKWTNKIAFHTYSWRSFMVTEFRGETFNDAQFPTGEAVLEFYEIEDTDRGNDMITLLFYTIILHLLSFVVLHVRYSWFTGSMLPFHSS